MVMFGMVSIERIDAGGPSATVAEPYAKPIVPQLDNVARTNDA
jgi:hypothetical protein